VILVVAPLSSILPQVPHLAWMKLQAFGAIIEEAVDDDDENSHFDEKEALSEKFQSSAISRKSLTAVSKTSILV
jgi:hypothetical protein